MVYLSVSLYILNHRNAIHRSGNNNDHRADKGALYKKDYKYIVAAFMVFQPVTIFVIRKKIKIRQVKW